MDFLQDMFQGRDPHLLRRAFEQAAGDVEIAVEIIFAELDDMQSRAIRQAEHDALAVEPEGPPIRHPLQALTISDIDDSDDSDDDTPTPQQHQGRNKAATPDDQQENIPSADECLAGVLAIFPDACTEHVKKVYNENRCSDIISFIVTKLAEEGYPHAVPEPKAGLKRKRPLTEDEEDEEDGKEYEAEHRAVSDKYTGFVRLLLKQEFPIMPVQYINRVLQQHRGFLAATHAALLEAERTYDSQENPPYRKLNNPRKILDNSEHAKMGNVWTEVINELDYARHKVRKEELKQQMESDAKLAAEMNEKEHEETNNLIECGCCFGEYPFDSMTHCNETHFFCLDCARRNAENEVGNGRHRLACMDGSGCKSEFSHREMLRFLDEKTLAALSKIEQEDVLRIAEIDGFVTCPFCDYGEICAPVEVDKEFRCQNSECGETSCRLCQQKSHIPQTCEEFAKENKLSVRHTVEEAMTEAMVRKCNKCSYPYIKEYGCNKIHCTRCNTLQCYICSQTIKNYDHFNDPTRGGKVGNCPLFDNTDQRHEEEIQAAAKKAVEKLREEDPELTEEDLQIQVSEAVKKAEQARLAQAGGGPNFNVPVYHHHIVPPPAFGPIQDLRAQVQAQVQAQAQAQAQIQAQAQAQAQVQVRAQAQQARAQVLAHARGQAQAQAQAQVRAQAQQAQAQQARAQVLAQAQAQAQARARAQLQPQIQAREQSQAQVQAQAQAQAMRVQVRLRAQAEVLARLQQARLAPAPAPAPAIDRNLPPFNGYNPAAGGRQQIYNPPAVAPVAGKASQPPPQNVAQYRGVQHRARPQQQANPPAVDAVRAANMRAGLRQQMGQVDGMGIQRVVQQAVNGNNAQPPRRR